MADGIVENKEIIERSRVDITRGNLKTTTHISRIKDLKLVQFTRNRTINHGIYLFDKKIIDTILLWDTIFHRQLV